MSFWIKAPYLVSVGLLSAGTNVFSSCLKVVLFDDRDVSHKPLKMAAALLLPNPHTSAMTLLWVDSQWRGEVALPWATTIPTVTVARNLTAVKIHRCGRSYFRSALILQWLQQASAAAGMLHTFYGWSAIWWHTRRFHQTFSTPLWSTILARMRRTAEMLKYPTHLLRLCVFPSTYMAPPNTKI